MRMQSFPTLMLVWITLFGASVPAFAQAPDESNFLVTTYANCRLYLASTLIQAQIRHISGKCGSSGFYGPPVVFGHTSTIQRIEGPNQVVPFEITNVTAGFLFEGRLTGLRMGVSSADAMVLVNPATKTAKAFHRSEPGFAIARVHAAIEEMVPSSGGHYADSALIAYLKDMATIWHNDGAEFVRLFTSGFESAVFRNPDVRSVRAESTPTPAASRPAGTSPTIAEPESKTRNQKPIPCESEIAAAGRAGFEAAAYEDQLRILRTLSPSNLRTTITLAEKAKQHTSQRSDNYPNLVARLCLLKAVAKENGTGDATAAAAVGDAPKVTGGGAKP